MLLLQSNKLRKWLFRSEHSSNLASNKTIMSVLDQVRIVIYRVNQKGLEVFMVNDGEEAWSFPQGLLNEMKSNQFSDDQKMIKLDPVADQQGNRTTAIAIEGDWHEIPSIRAMIKTDVQIVKDQIKLRVPELEQGAYFAVKECFRKVLPHEYSMIKELKDIIRDRNSVKYI